MLIVPEFCESRKKTEMSRVFCYFLFLFPAIVICDDYHENLDIFHLPNNDLAAKLRFTSRKSVGDGVVWSSHYDLFPKTIGDLVQKYNVHEFHLSLTQGFWRMRQWGFPVNPTGSPTGAQIWSWFSPNLKNVDETWRNFIHALSGVFCASFSQIDEKLTVAPEFAYRPEGVGQSNNNSDNKFIRYGTLPSENVCTENLTPWKKLLPCKSGGGIGRLLTPLKLYSANYHSLNVDFRRICSDEQCKTIMLELTQTVVVVFDRSFAKSWTLMNLFGHYIDKPCHLAANSFITVKVPSKYKPKFTPSLNNSQIVEGQFILANFNVDQVLNDHNYLNLMVEYAEKLAFGAVLPPSVSLHSYSAGTGQYKGILTSHIENADDKPKKILYSHVIPWFLRIYYHTLVVSCNDKATKPDFVVYQPARDRQRPHYIEIALEMPSQSSCKVTLDYEKLLLRWTEYPPDANHGFYVPGPSVSFFKEFGTTSNRINISHDNPDRHRFVRIYGEIMLINLPTPDFSMPYNVICLVCTVVALAFGPIHNLTTRRLVVKDPDEVKKKSLKNKIKNFLTSIKSKLFAKKKGDEQADKPKSD